MQLTYTKALLADIIKQETDPTVVGPGKLSGAKLALFSNSVTPSPKRVFADLTECVYSGYAESAVIVWGPAVNEVDGTVTSIAPSHLFQMTGGVTGDTAAGIAITDGVASPNQGLLALGLFDSPFVFVNSGDGFSVIVAYNNQGSSANAEIVIAS